jgi:hypothetical protein
MSERECRFPKFIQCQGHPGYGAALCTHAAQALQDDLYEATTVVHDERLRCATLQRRVEEAELNASLADKARHDARCLN